MKKEIKILFVDDHNITLKGIASILKDTDNLSFNIYTKTNPDKAYEAIKLASKIEPFDIVFSDLSFSQQNLNIKSGDEFVRILNRDFPEIKKGIITGHSETNRVYNVIQNSKPSAYLLKESVIFNELLFAVDCMLKGETYYNQVVHQKILKRSVIQISMDEVSLQILEQLPKHFKIKNLVGHIKNDSGKELKLRSIENKLSELRQILNANNNTDLVLKAKELGIID